MFSGVLENEIVAIAIQRRFKTTADLTSLYTKLEMMSGIPSIALRNAQELDPYALVFQRGKRFHILIFIFLQIWPYFILVFLIPAISHVN